ncbi:hypothetical protein Tco_0434705 [Tanacetum coccineum]
MESNDGAILYEANLFQWIFNSLVHSLRALSTLRRCGLRTASAAAKPCQGDSSEFYLITGRIPDDFDYREESETEEESGESEEESSNEDKGLEDDSEVKMYINKKNKIQTRNPPKSLANIMSKLTDTQIESLKDMGFGSFVGYKINRFPTALARWIFLNYDPRTSVLQARDVKIKITSQTVHDIFGLPIGGKEIVEVNQAKKTDEVIEEWRIIAVKTTPEKERMTKSKIIAAKNAIMRKSSCFRKKKLLKRASEMNKKDKERPCKQIFEVDREPMLENVPLTFTRITAKLKLPPKKEKEQDSTTIASTTVKFLELVEVVSTTVKEPSTFLLLNDTLSFDLGLTPTPLDVNLDRDTAEFIEPMLENERVKKNAKEQGTTNTTSPVDALALSFAMLNITLVTYAIERKRKDLPMLENEHVKKNAKESGPTNTRIAFDVVPLSFAMSNATLVTDERQKHVEVILSISHWIK